MFCDAVRYMTFTFWHFYVSHAHVVWSYVKEHTFTLCASALCSNTEVTPLSFSGHGFPMPHAFSCGYPNSCSPGHGYLPRPVVATQTPSLQVMATQTPPPKVIATEVAQLTLGHDTQTHPLYLKPSFQGHAYLMPTVSWLPVPKLLLPWSWLPKLLLPRSFTSLPVNSSHPVLFTHQELFYPVPWLVEFPPPKVMVTQPSPPRSRPP